MTRKERAELLAAQWLIHHGDQRLIQPLAALLLQVEREVWEVIKAEVTQHPYTYCAHSDDRHPESILVEWIEQQKEAL